MLVLTRKQGETIHVGEAITVIVKRIGNGHVRIGVRAPDNTAIVRGELHKEALLNGPAFAALYRCQRLNRVAGQPCRRWWASDGVCAAGQHSGCPHATACTCGAVSGCVRAPTVPVFVVGGAGGGLHD